MTSFEPGITQGVSTNLTHGWVIIVAKYTDSTYSGGCGHWGYCRE